MEEYEAFCRFVSLERNHGDFPALAVPGKPGSVFQNNPDHVPERGWEGGGLAEHSVTHTRARGGGPTAVLLRLRSRRSANSISCARRRKDLSHCCLAHNNGSRGLRAPPPPPLASPSACQTKGIGRLSADSERTYAPDGKVEGIKTGAHKRVREQGGQKKPNTRGELAAAASDRTRGG